MDEKDVSPRSPPRPDPWSGFAVVGDGPPEKIWEYKYEDGGIFYDVESTDDSCLVLAAHHSHFHYAGALQKADMDGSIL